MASLQCYWIYEDSFHEWKLVPFHLVNTTVTIAFKFHPNLALSVQLDQFLKLYQHIFHLWNTCFHAASTVPSIILFEFLWFNRNITVDNRPIFLSFFLKKKLISNPYYERKWKNKILEWLIKWIWVRATIF